MEQRRILTPQGLTLTLLGEPRIAWQGRPLPLPSLQARALAGCLALAPQMSETRERLAALFWPDAPEGRARATLRQLAHALRGHLPDPARALLTGDRDRLGLAHGHVTTDLDALFEALAAGDLPDALFDAPPPAERLLAGCERLSETFASWLAQRRTALAARLRSRLGALAATAPAPVARKAAEALLAADPSDEGAARALIGSLAASGDTGGALTAYARLWTHLDEEYGAEPSPATQALIVRIKTAEPPAADPPAPARRPRVTVLPAGTSGLDDHLTAAARAVRDDCLARLGRFRELTVLDGAIATGPADYALRLGALGTGAGIAASAALVATADGAVVWSGQRQMHRDGRCALLDGIAGGLAAACNIGLTRRRSAALQAGLPAEDAFDLWLLGQAAIHSFRPEGWAEAEARFAAAAARDPGFARAHSSLAQLANTRHLMLPGQRPDPDRLRAGLAHADRAVAADPHDAQAHLARAWAALLLDRHAQAGLSFAQARQCNPDDPWVVISAALGTAFGGDAPAGLDGVARFAAEGWTLTETVWGYAASIRLLAGDDAGCVEAAEAAGARIVNLPGWKAAALARLGRAPEAAAAWGEMEMPARAMWSGPPPGPEGVRDWFLSLFPLRRPADRARLAEAARAAFDAYRHCETE